MCVSCRVCPDYFQQSGLCWIARAFPKEMRTSIFPTVAYIYWPQQQQPTTTTHKSYIYIEYLCIDISEKPGFYNKFSIGSGKVFISSVNGTSGQDGGWKKSSLFFIHFISELVLAVGKLVYFYQLHDNLGQRVNKSHSL